MQETQTQSEIPEIQLDLDEELNRILQHHVLLSMSAGLVPIPIIDFAGVTAIQMMMLTNIANTFDVPFSKEKTKSILASLIGGATPAMVGGHLASGIKFIPIFGQYIGSATMPLIAGASTYAVGKVFIQHFASGGTLLDFSPEKAKAYYAKMFEEGKKMVSSLKKEKKE